MTLSQFLAMGGFAFYVWSAYAFTALVVTINTVRPLIQRRKVWRSLRRDLDHEEEE